MRWKPEDEVDAHVVDPRTAGDLDGSRGAVRTMQTSHPAERARVEALSPEADAIYTGPAPTICDIGRKALRVGFGGPLELRICESSRADHPSEFAHRLRPQQRRCPASDVKRLQIVGKYKEPLLFYVSKLTGQRSHPALEVPRLSDGYSEVAVQTAPRTEGGVHIHGADLHRTAGSSD